MNDMTTTKIPAIGEPFGGGFFGGLHYPAGIRKGLIVGPKALCQAPRALIWGERGVKTGATSLFDGMANTRALGEASPAAKFCLDCRAGGEDDWHLPALDQLSVLRANCMPKAGRIPEQSIAEVFKEGGPEAFDTDDWYWSSTEWSAGYAWVQDFGYGNQYDLAKNLTCRVRAVRECLL